MSPITKWGPATWLLFHTLAEKIPEEDQKRMIPLVFLWIKHIAYNLPCPQCAEHAKEFLSKVPLRHIQTKYDFKSMIFTFHNAVNVRKRKRMFSFDNMNMYENVSLDFAVRNFLTFYNTKGNMQLIAESTQRRYVITHFIAFIRKELMNFKGHSITNEQVTQTKTFPSY
jgi:hypothetical protein